MNVEDFRNYCLHFKGAREDFPFDEKTITFKVRGSIFALADVEAFGGIVLKCDAVKAAMLRDLYEEVRPAEQWERYDEANEEFVIDQRHWNNVDPVGGLGDELIKEWIKDSYELVVDGLPRKEQKKLEED